MSSCAEGAMRIVLVSAVLLSALSMAGCAVVPTINPQVSASAQVAGSEQFVLAYHPQMGFVRGTRSVLANFGRPLEPASGPNRAVEACREAAWAEAVKLGARNIEAASAGPEHVNAKRQCVGPVRMRITYDKPVSGYEVREATLTCVVDRKGKLIKAFDPKTAASEIANGSQAPQAALWQPS